MKHVNSHHPPLIKAITGSALIGIYHWINGIDLHLCLAICFVVMHYEWFGGRHGNGKSYDSFHSRFHGGGCVISTSPHRRRNSWCDALGEKLKISELFLFPRVRFLHMKLDDCLISLTNRFCVVKWRWT